MNSSPPCFDLWQFQSFHHEGRELQPAVGVCQHHGQSHTQTGRSDWSSHNRGRYFMPVSCGNHVSHPSLDRCVVPGSSEVTLFPLPAGWYVNQLSVIWEIAFKAPAALLFMDLLPVFSIFQSFVLLHICLYFSVSLLLLVEFIDSTWTVHEMQFEGQFDCWKIKKKSFRLPR